LKLQRLLEFCGALRSGKIWWSFKNGGDLMEFWNRWRFDGALRSAEIWWSFENGRDLMEFWDRWRFDGALRMAEIRWSFEISGDLMELWDQRRFDGALRRVFIFQMKLLYYSILYKSIQIFKKYEKKNLELSIEIGSSTENIKNFPNSLLPQKYQRNQKITRQDLFLHLLLITALFIKLQVL
jgi:hypothetical protein